MERVSNYLHASTRPKLRHIVESELISSHASALIELKDTGFHSLLRQSEDKLDDLKRMYDLFFQVPGTLDLLRTALYEHVRSTGQQLVDAINIKEPVGFLRSLLALRDKYASVVRIAFNCETPAQKKMKEAFEGFINADTRCVLSLVAYIDELMRSGFKGATEREVERGLDKVIVIFRYLQDKDVFEVLYKQHLAKRLLSQRSSSFEAERQMLAKLKGECGYQYTTKLEGMFTDIKFSRAAMEKYRAHQETRPRCVDETSKRSIKNHAVSSLPTLSRIDKTPPCDIDVTMLTAGYWPLNCSSACLLPCEVKIAAAFFEDFYLSKHTGRKLAWLTSCGTGEVKATFSEVAKHELAVSAYQMCILSLFNTVDYETELPLKDIAALTKIPNNELKRHLISLCTPKHRILLKRSKGKGLSTDESFKVNVGFLSKLKRIRVPLVAMKEVVASPNSNTSIPVSVEEDRRHLCEATVVRIMKTRKLAKHNDLIAEVTRQLNKRFYPQPQFIKKSIESLLEREYLERCADDSRSYIYVA
jgi:cullin 3